MKQKNEYINNKELEKNIFLFQEVKYKKLIFEMFLNEIKEIDKKTSKRGWKKPQAWEQLNGQYQIVSGEYLTVQKELAAMLGKLAQNLAIYKKFKLIDEDEAIQEGVFICFEKLHLFDAKKGTAFTYLTTCIVHHFQHLYRCAKNYINLKYKYQDHYDRKHSQQNFRNKFTVKALNSYSDDE